MQKNLRSSHSVMLNKTAAALAACAALTLPLPSHTQTATTAPAGASPGAPLTLAFNAAEIETIARAIAVATNRIIVVDPRVKGQMNLNSDRQISPSAAFNMFAAQLRLQGFALVDAQGVLKVVPESEAKLQSSSVITELPVSSAKRASNAQVVTQIFKLQNENANNLVAILRPLISPNNIINVNPGNNSLVITDYADNLERVARIVAAMDVSNTTEMEVIRLKHALAQDISGIVLRFTGDPGRTTVIPEPRTNSLLVRSASPARLMQIKSLVEKLDQPTSAQASGNIHVVYLKNADATKLANTLRAAMAGGGGSAPAPAPAPVAPGAAAAPAASGGSTTGGMIQADVATNSLIITAPEPVFRQMRSVIDALDQRRAQVFVESLIAEVSSERAAEFGIQWQGALGKSGDKNIGILGTNFGTGGNNIINLASQGASGNVAPGSGLNLGIARETNGVYVLGFLARFLEGNNEGNVLSMPNMLTLDNEEAKFIVGQNVPFITGQFTNTGASGGGATNPFQTIERKDVGLTLRVKPQISENGSVKLQIFQEVSSVVAASRNSPTGLITNKHSIESNVVVEDGGIVVLSGLLQDDYSGGVQKIPGAGDIPFFGNLFKSQNRNRVKSNLMVFIRPVVVRDASSLQTFSLDRYEFMRVTQKDTQPEPSKLVPINEAPVLPPLVAPAAKPAASSASSPK
jgi:general secretion pathway protein D